MPAKKIPPIHPGEILMQDFLLPLGLSQYRLAKDTGVSPRRINEIVLSKRAITADTALRLARFFGTSAEFWLNLQTRYDLETVRDAPVDRLEASPRNSSAKPFMIDNTVMRLATPNAIPSSDTRDTTAIKRLL